MAPASTPFTLCDGVVELGILPAMGGGMTHFDFVAGNRREPLFRPQPAGGASGPFDLACNVLVPWSNRVSQGGFDFEGRHHPLAPNLPGEAFPIHGNGFSEAWTLLERHDNAARLELISEGPGPYRYRSELTYALADGVLSLGLSVVNRGTIALPFGLGLHPWLVRDADTVLTAPTEAVWLEDARHLPVGETAGPIPRDWDFSAPSPLPAGFINNAFSGWSGRATVAWPGRNLALDIETDADLGLYIVYSPAADADFFCFEPISHPVDAFHLPGGPLAHGMRRLAPGEGWDVTTRLYARRMGAR